MLSTILKELNLRPTCIVGGIVKNLGGHALKGDSDYLVAEADESDGSFLFLNPIISIITNIDNDHLDYYKNLDHIIESFQTFVDNVDPEGFIITNFDDKNWTKVE